VVLKIWGGHNSCSKDELLWESVSIKHTEWKTYNFTIKPTLSDCNYIILEVKYDSTEAYFGSMLIDNIKLDKYFTSTVVLDTTIYYNEEIILNASDGEYYNWYPSIGLSCNNCKNPIATIKEQITYKATITDSNGCSKEEIFIIDLRIDIPNVFTPNNDGKNDFLKINDLPPNSSIEIFNRWGVLIFEDNNYNNYWNGITVNGKKVSQGIYYYVLKIPGTNLDKTGFIYIIY
ncbi:unnamed protein product, partial [marine sediment metagenome]